MNESPLRKAAAAAFRAALKIAGVDLSGENGVKCQCISAPFVISKGARDSGLWLQITTTAELFDFDAQRLGVADRSIVILKCQRFRVMAIESHDLSPTVKIHLKPEH